jgi:hypothetical protein
VIKIDLDQLRQLVNQQPDATARQLHERRWASVWWRKCRTVIGRRPR